MRYALVAVIITAAACGARQEVAYRFRGPLLGSVRAPELPDVPSKQDTRDRAQDTGHRRPEKRAARVAMGRARPVEAPPVPRVRRSLPAEVLAAQGSGEELAKVLRGMVGRRDEGSTHVQYVLAGLTELGAALDPELGGVEDGPALRALAERRGALGAAAPGSPLPSLRLGDLLVFDRVVATDPASLVAIVVSVDERGVVEFVYLARGVVRRGFVFPPEPGSRRDPTGRILNTFVRHNDGGDPRGTAHLAGELVAGAIALDRLLR